MGHLILNLANVVHTPYEMEINATWDAEQKALYYKNRTGAWTAGGPNSVAFLPLGNYTDRAADIISSYSSQDATDHLRTGLDGSVLAGFKKQHEVLLRHLSTAKMAAM